MAGSMKAHDEIYVKNKTVSGLQGDPDNGIAQGTAFEDIPEEWTCPLCGVGKENFSPES